MKQTQPAIRIIAEVCRLLIGVVFVFSGFVKAVDPVGFAIKINDYLEVWGLEASRTWPVIISFGLIAIEFMLGICLLLGVYRRYASFFVLLFMVVMTPLTLYLALFNPVSDCGCFGDALVLTNWETFYKNLVLLAAAIFVCLYSRRLFQCYTYKVYWFVAMYAYVYCIGFSYWNYSHLPVIDFRPYKTGADIPALMEIPVGAAEDEYRYMFIYEKEGVRKAFSLEDYPANDPAWTFVEAKTELVKEGYRPVIESFGIYDASGEEAAGLILENTGGVLLLVSSRLEEANDDRIDDINNLYDYALERRIPFYCLTASSGDEILKWTDDTGAEYPFLMADDILLKTMIRSNPGLVLMKEGRILMKWHYKDMPEEEDIDGVITAYLEGKHADDERNGWIVFNLMAFTVPLSLVWLYDMLRFRRRKEKKE
ncbi:MAG: DoxX family protein [Tannerellaceae bacterium]|jgi:uncharacterized membrane protein YphA (DoxX/SURF4 family)|nr:DoxX family protein [Tannerellaceae bacterium]